MNPGRQREHDAGADQNRPRGRWRRSPRCRAVGLVGRRGDGVDQSPPRDGLVARGRPERRTAAPRRWRRARPYRDPAEPGRRPRHARLRARRLPSNASGLLNGWLPCGGGEQWSLAARAPQALAVPDVPSCPASGAHLNHPTSLARHVQTPHERVHCGTGCRPNRGCSAAMVAYPQFPQVYPHVVCGRLATDRTMTGTAPSRLWITLRSRPDNGHRPIAVGRNWLVG